MQIDGPDERRPGDGRSVAEGTYATVGRVRVAIQDTQLAAPALRGARSGGGYGCSDNLGAVRGIPKKKTMSSLQAEDKSHGEKPVPLGPVPS